MYQHREPAHEAGSLPRWCEACAELKYERCGACKVWDMKHPSGCGLPRPYRVEFGAANGGIVRGD